MYKRQVLVGGGAKLPGIAEFAREKLQISARIGALQPIGGLQDTVDDLAFSTPVGLMILDMLLLPSDGAAAGAPVSGVFGMVEGLMRRMRRPH